MFDAFSSRILDIFDRLRRSGILKESDVDNALREIRIALLEADVSLEVAKKFIVDVKEKAVGRNVIQSVSPGQMVTKIVHDHLIDLLGESRPLVVAAKSYKIMVVGLQGSGKTTSVGKLARLFSRQNKKVVTSSTDIYRPAAIEQLRVLSSKVDGTVFAPSHDRVDEICKSALKTLENEGADVLIMDTAGRLHIDEVKMHELQQIRQIIQPDEIFLVVDVMTGQDALNIAKKFSGDLPISGIILTRVDGDARGGVALSMRAITGCEIKFLCTGEHLDSIEFFHAERIADRLLGKGDIVSFVKKAQTHFSEEEAQKTVQKMQSGTFTFDDMAAQIEKMSQMGGLKTILKMLPQNRELNKLIEANGVSDNMITRNLAIIRSMTKKEKQNYKLLNGSRRRRIAAGSGTSVQDVNRLIKQYEGSLDLFKKMRKNIFGKNLSVSGR
ncbi:MAG: signal recognition particle protein [Holosporaceae bacterium]|jgi:signal recognition particle subunit SRP54|nr:signal recognition particle protein [Holosporaceae bacterium]